MRAVFFLCWLTKIPFVALHGMCSQRQGGDGPLVNSCGKRATAVLRMSCLSTALRVLFTCGVCFITNLKQISFVRASDEVYNTSFFGASENKRDGCPLGDPDKTASCPARLAASTCIPRNDALEVCLCFGFDKFAKTNNASVY